MEAEESDDVSAVGVEVLALAGAVEAHLGPGPFDALVSHVAKERAFGVLADRGAEVEAEREVRELDLHVTQQVNWESPDEHEAVTLGEGPYHLAEGVAEGRQRHVVDRDRGDRASVGGCRASDSGDLVALVVAELDRPAGWVGQIGRGPDGCRFDRRAVGVGRGHQQQRASASGTDAQHSESPVWSSTLTELSPKASLSARTV